MGNFVAGLIVFIALAGMGCILYDLIFGKDTYSTTTVSYKNKSNNKTTSKSFADIETLDVILEDEP